jgi:transcriptional regulator with XRE-family HTH domain
MRGCHGTRRVGEHDESMRDEDRAGARIAAQRKLAGLTQHQLAERAHVSVSLLRKVEQGTRLASSGLIASVARALRIEQTRLTGQPYHLEPAGNGTLRAVDDLRRELTSHGLPTDEPIELPTLDQLAQEVAEVSALRHRAAYGRLSEALPVLLVRLRAASFVHTEARREQVMGLLSETYDAASIHAFVLGYPDLATLAATLTEQAADESGDPLRSAVGRALRASYLSRGGSFAAAQAVVTGVLDGLGTPRTASAWSVWGFLQLQGALAAARSGNADKAWERYGLAQDAASRFGADRDDYRRAFGPTNVAIWGTALAVELMDGPAAAERARAVHLRPDTPPERAGHYYIDLARGLFYNGDRAGTLTALLTAQQTAPHLVRYHPMAHETVHALARTDRRANERLRELATWMGMTD